MCSSICWVCVRKCPAPSALHLLEVPTAADEPRRVARLTQCHNVNTSSLITGHCCKLVFVYMFLCLSMYVSFSLHHLHHVLHGLCELLQMESPGLMSSWSSQLKCGKDNIVRFQTELNILTNFQQHFLNRPLKTQVKFTHGGVCSKGVSMDLMKNKMISFIASNRMYASPA